MAKRLLPVAVLGVAPLMLAGCADKAPDGPPVPVQLNGGTVYLSPRNPIVKEYQRMLCNGTVCRETQSVHLRIPNGPDFVEESALRMPYVVKNEIILLPGETVLAEADEGADGLTNLRYVDKVTHPEKTLTVAFEQRPDIAGGYGMRLTISNPFARALKYKIGETRPGAGEAEFAVGLCPALPRGESRKNWPYPVAQVVIANFTFVSTEEAEACAP